MAKKSASETVAQCCAQVWSKCTPCSPEWRNPAKPLLSEWPKSARASEPPLTTLKSIASWPATRKTQPAKSAFLQFAAVH
eukprot:7909867-Pyramimonas_sp.AAC.1